jgi:hypothetical protein
MKAIVSFQGFTESDAARTGMEDLYFSVIRKYAREDVTTYQPRTWTANVQALAYQLNRQGIRHAAMVSYSHGQAAACDFARHCYDLGISIDLWAACDPVYRPVWLPRHNWFQPLAFRAMGLSASISVPANVRRVAWARQTISRPQGHDLRANSPLTYVQKPLVLPYSHTSIDNAPEWFELVKAELTHWIHPPKAEPV